MILEVTFRVSVGRGWRLAVEREARAAAVLGCPGRSLEPSTPWGRLDATRPNPCSAGRLLPCGAWPLRAGKSGLLGVPPPWLPPAVALDVRRRLGLEPGPACRTLRRALPWKRKLPPAPEAALLGQGLGVRPVLGRRPRVHPPATAQGASTHRTAQSPVCPAQLSFSVSRPESWAGRGSLATTVPWNGGRSLGI